jgi:sulfite oxidase
MINVDKHPEFMVHTEQPLNGGVPLPLLREQMITPTDRFFVRNHGTIPDVDPASYRLTVEGQVHHWLSLSLAQLQHQFERVALEATLQCAGNRRTELFAVAPIPGELPWGPEAIGNAQWAGARLSDVLAAAGVDPSAQHVAFTGLDEVQRHSATFGFGSSIAMAKALHGEVLLAYEMNGAPLTPTHGFPVRVVAPGYIGARSVKWLGTITLQEHPSTNYFQARAYRLFAPGDRPDNVHWERGLMLSEQSVNAVICTPQSHTVLPAGPVHVEGYAMAGGGRHIARVDLSRDGGVTWMQAELEGKLQPWTWQLWRAQLNIPPGEHQLVVRAIDSAANTQPTNPRDVWNFKGYMNNAWHRVDVRVSE